MAGFGRKVIDAVWNGASIFNAPIGTKVQRVVLVALKALLIHSELQAFGINVVHSALTSSLNVNVAQPVITDQAILVGTAL